MARREILTLREYYRSKKEALALYVKLKKAGNRRSYPNKRKPTDENWRITYETENCFHCGSRLTVGETNYGMGPGCDYAIVHNHQDPKTGKNCVYGGCVEVIM